jgi:hypothetical protein
MVYHLQPSTVPIDDMTIKSRSFLNVDVANAILDTLPSTYVSYQRISNIYLSEDIARKAQRWPRLRGNDVRWVDISTESPLVA